MFHSLFCKRAPGSKAICVRRYMSPPPTVPCRQKGVRQRTYTVVMRVCVCVLLQKATGWRYYAAVAYNFLAEPTTSTWAMTWSLLMILVIVLSTIVFILSTLTSLSEQSIRAYDDIETACVIIFTFDYVSR